MAHSRLVGCVLVVGSNQCTYISNTLWFWNKGESYHVFCANCLITSCGDCSHHILSTHLALSQICLMLYFKFIVNARIWMNTAGKKCFNLISLCIAAKMSDDKGVSNLFLGSLMDSFATYYNLPCYDCFILSETDS